MAAGTSMSIGCRLLAVKIALQPWLNSGETTWQALLLYLASQGIFIVYISLASTLIPARFVPSLDFGPFLEARRRPLIT
jgi:hypothetical protein